MSEVIYARLLGALSEVVHLHDMAVNPSPERVEKWRALTCSAEAVLGSGDLDPADIWHAYVDEVSVKNRSPQGALAFGFWAAIAHSDDHALKVGKLKNALHLITEIKNKEYGSDWEEIEEARNMAFAALAELDPPRERGK